MTPSRKNTLFIMQATPYGSSVAAEGIDALLAAGAFEQNPGVLFIADGVFQLLREQSPRDGARNIGKKLQALPMYDIDQIYVCQESLTARQIPLNSLCLNVKALNPRETSQLFRRYHHILSF